MRQKTLILLLFMSLGLSLAAQTVQVQAKFDSVGIFIGDQTCLRVEAAYVGDRKLSFPIYQKEEIPGLELIEMLGYDTLKGSDGTTKITAKYLFTGWDSAVVFIPGVPVVEGGDTFMSNAVSLKIADVPVDTAKAICDIKPVYDPPFDWQLLWTIVIILVIVAALTVAGIIVYRKYLKGRKWGKKKGGKVIVEDPRPADIIAMEQLERLRSEKLWQEGRNKEYYSALTDIVKSYVSRRYGINAVEQTTDDLLRELRMNTTIDIQKEPVETLQDVLRLADLVKFAKWTPLPAENERAFEDGRQFVQSTRKIEEIKTKEVKK